METYFINFFRLYSGVGTLQIFIQFKLSIILWGDLFNLGLMALNFLLFDSISSSGSACHTQSSLMIDYISLLDPILNYSGWSCSVYGFCSFFFFFWVFGTIDLEANISLLDERRYSQGNKLESLMRFLSSVFSAVRCQ